MCVYDMQFNVNAGCGRHAMVKLGLSLEYWSRKKRSRTKISFENVTGLVYEFQIVRSMFEYCRAGVRAQSPPSSRGAGSWRQTDCLSY